MRRCGQNEELKNCGSNCESTCENPYPVVCSYQCILNVCECAKGYARHFNGRCIPISQCDNNQVNDHRQYVK